MCDCAKNNFLEQRYGSNITHDKKIFNFEFHLSPFIVFPFLKSGW